MQNDSNVISSEELLIKLILSFFFFSIIFSGAPGDRGWPGHPGETGESGYPGPEGGVGGQGPPGKFSFALSNACQGIVHPWITFLILLLWKDYWNVHFISVFCIIHESSLLSKSSPICVYNYKNLASKEFIKDFILHLRVKRSYQIYLRNLQGNPGTCVCQNVDSIIVVDQAPDPEPDPWPAHNSHQQNPVQIPSYGGGGQVNNGGGGGGGDAYGRRKKNDLWRFMEGHKQEFFLATRKNASWARFYHKKSKNTANVFMLKNLFPFSVQIFLT